MALTIVLSLFFGAYFWNDTSEENVIPEFTLNGCNLIVALVQTAHLFSRRNEIIKMGGRFELFALYPYLIINGWTKEYDLYTDIIMIKDFQKQKSDKPELVKWFIISLAVFVVALAARTYSTVQVCKTLIKSKNIKI